jgi:hypothetical protein
MEDPYFYKDRLTMPKLVINAVMDEFQQPDDTHYWWSDMPEPKHFMIIPNAEHSLATGILEAVPAIGAFIYNHLVKDYVPKVTWDMDNTTGQITAYVDERAVVHSATMFWAYSCGQNAFDNNKLRRDYRVAHLDNPCACGIYAEGMCANLKSLWMKQTLTQQGTSKGKKVFTAKMDAPGDGRWVAFFIDFKLVNKNAFLGFDMPALYAKINKNRKQNGLKDKNGLVHITDKYGVNEDFGGIPHDFGRFFEFTTEVSVYPNTFPYPDCSGAACGAVPIV